MVREHNPGCTQFQPQEQYSWLFHNGLKLTTAQGSENRGQGGDKYAFLTVKCSTNDSPQNKHERDLKATRTTLATNLKAGSTSCSLDRAQCKVKARSTRNPTFYYFFKVPHLREALSLQGISCFTILVFSGENFRTQRGFCAEPAITVVPRSILFLCLWPFRDTNTLHYHSLFSWQHPPPQLILFTPRLVFHRKQLGQQETMPMERQSDCREQA